MVGKQEQIEFYKKVGALVRKARVERELKQEYVANQLGLTRTSIVNIEQGEQKIQLHAILLLAKLYEMDVREFFPDIEKFSNTTLTKDSEEKISEVLEKQVIQDSAEVLKKIRNFIKYTQRK